MRRLALVALATAGLMLPSASRAADERGAFAVKSMGTATCRHYLDARAKGDREYVLFAGYLGGYVTAYNQLTPGTFDILPWQSVDTLLRMMASYCQKNPSTVLAVAVTSLVRVLEADKLTSPSSMVEAGTGKKRTQIYREALVRAQEKLAELGFYKRNPNGEFDAATRRALEQYQERKGIPKTGLPDQHTLFQLFLARH